MLMRSTLADRIRGVLRTQEKGSEDSRPEPPADPSAADLESVLGGDWRQRDGTSCFVVETRREPSSVYGAVTVGTLARRLDEAAAGAALVAGTPAPLPFRFFDLETTGLSGGAGTYAFLVGFGSFDEGGAFGVRQFVLTRFADERALLESASRELTRAGSLVSFNGKSFDTTVLETRFLFHRLNR